MTFKFKYYDKVYNLNTILSTYEYNDNTAIMLFDKQEGPFATITVNIDPLPEGYAYLDTNNCPWVIDLFKKYGFGEYTGSSGYSGYCEYPLYKLNMEALKLYE